MVLGKAGFRKHASRDQHLLVALTHISKVIV